MRNGSFDIFSPANKSTMFFYVVYVVVNLCISASHQQQRPRIVSGPSHPVIGRRQGGVTFMWMFTLWPGKTWNESVEEVGFGIWEAPGYLRTKLMVIDKQGDVLIRSGYQDKINCTFNMSRLQVAFKLHNLSMEDEKQYGLHVEFGLRYNPLTDAVALRLHDPPKIISPLKRNVSLKIGDNLELKCEATGFPYPQVTWTRQGRRIRNQSLVLNRVSKNDSGPYLCKAFNTDGEDSMKVIVTIEDKEKSTQATVSSATPSEPISRVLIIFVAASSGLVAFIFLAVLLYCFHGRLKKGASYARQIDTETQLIVRHPSSII